MSRLPATQRTEHIVLSSAPFAVKAASKQKREHVSLPHASAMFHFVYSLNSMATVAAPRPRVKFREPATTRSKHHLANDAP